MIATPPFFFPKSMWTRLWAQNAITDQTSTRMTHLKVRMIIISCWDCTLHFNVFITKHMGALVRLWKGGIASKQLGGTKMTVWQPFISTWMAKSGEPSPGNLKVWMSKRVHFRPLFLKIIAATRKSIDTDRVNTIHSNVVLEMMSVWSCLIFNFALFKNVNLCSGQH